MFPLALVALLAAAPQPRMLVMALEPLGVPDTLSRTIDPMVATAAQDAGALVVSEADIKQMAEVEANSQALGCDTRSNSCLAEIAGAMGADLVLYGTVSQLGASTVVSLSLFDTKSAQVQRDAVSVATLDELPGALPPHVRALVQFARPSTIPAAVQSNGGGPPLFGPELSCAEITAFACSAPVSTDLDSDGVPCMCQ